MSGTDANYRAGYSPSDADWRRGSSTGGEFGGFNPGGNSSDGPPPIGLPTVNSFVIACGVSLDWFVRATDLPPVYRSTNYIQNQAYHAAHGNFQIDFPGPVDVTVTGGGVAGFVLYRDKDHYWYGDQGVITLNVTNLLTGPFVLEVWSGLGCTFHVQVSCAPAIQVTAYWTFDHTDDPVEEV